MNDGRPVWAREELSGQQFLLLGYTAGPDVQGTPPDDKRLAVFDLWTNAAHLAMLAGEGLIPADAARDLARGMGDLVREFRDGEGLLNPECEDIHMSIESALAARIGDAAGWLHTGRSRNDQAATTVRLWLRRQVWEAMRGIRWVAEALVRRARQWAEVPAPGFTHGQPAMVSTLGFWALGWVPPLRRMLAQAEELLEAMDECPLGGAAGFGTSWGVDRMRTARTLGFSRTTMLASDGPATRGEFEARYAFLLAEFFGLLSRLGADLMAWSTVPRRWLQLPAWATTGSSIMPQKRNPDFAEVTIARAAMARSYADAVLGSTQGVPSGYHRAMQFTKHLAMRAADNLDGADAVFAGVIGEMEPDRAALRAACAEGFLEAADLADGIARRDGLPFRRAYQLVREMVHRCTESGVLDRETVNAVLQEGDLAPLSGEDWNELRDPLTLASLRSSSHGPDPRLVLARADAEDEALAEIEDRIADWMRAWGDPLAVPVWRELKSLAGESTSG